MERINNLSLKYIFNQLLIVMGLLFIVLFLNIQNAHAQYGNYDSEGYYSKSAWQQNQLELLPVDPELSILTFYMCTMFNSRMNPWFVPCGYLSDSIPMMLIIDKIFNFSNVALVLAVLILCQFTVLLIEQAVTGQFLGGKPIAFLIRILIICLLLLPMPYVIYFSSTPSTTVSSNANYWNDYPSQQIDETPQIMFSQLIGLNLMSFSMKFANLVSDKLYCMLNHINSSECNVGAMGGGTKTRAFYTIKGTSKLPNITININNTPNLNYSLITKMATPGYYPNTDYRYIGKFDKGYNFRDFINSSPDYLHIDKAWVKYISGTKDDIFNYKLDSDEIETPLIQLLSSDLSYSRFFFGRNGVITYTNLEPVLSSDDLKNCEKARLYTSIMSALSPDCLINGCDSAQCYKGQLCNDFISNNFNLGSIKGVGANASVSVAACSDALKPKSNTFHLNEPTIMSDHTHAIDTVIPEINIGNMNNEFAQLVEQLWQLAGCMNAQAYYCINIKSEQNSLHMCPSPASRRLLFDTEEFKPLYPSLSNVFRSGSDTEKISFNSDSVYEIPPDLYDLNFFSTSNIVTTGSIYKITKSFIKENNGNKGVYFCPTHIYPQDPLSSASNYSSDYLMKFDITQPKIRFGWWEGTSTAKMINSPINFYNWMRNISTNTFAQQITQQGNSGDICSAPEYNKKAGEQCGFIDFSEIDKLDFYFLSGSDYSASSSVLSQKNYNTYRRRLIRFEVLKLYQIFTQIHQAMLIKKIKNVPVFPEKTFSSVYGDKLSPVGGCVSDIFNTDATCKPRSLGQACGSFRNWIYNENYFHGPLNLQKQNANLFPVTCNMKDIECNIDTKAQCASVWNHAEQKGRCKFPSVYCSEHGKKNECLPNGYYCDYSVGNTSYRLQYDELGMSFCEDYTNNYSTIVSQVITDTSLSEVLRQKVVKYPVSRVESTEKYYSEVVLNGLPYIQKGANRCLFEANQAPPSNCPGWGGGPFVYSR